MGVYRDNHLKQMRDSKKLREVEVANLLGQLETKRDQIEDLSQCIRALEGVE